MDTSMSFEEACAMHRFPLLQEAVRDLSKRDAVDHLHDLFPHKARKWFVRNFAYLMALDPDDFARAMYPDPTAETAIRNVDSQRRLAELATS